MKEKETPAPDHAVKLYRVRRAQIEAGRGKMNGLRSDRRDGGGQFEQFIEQGTANGRQARDGANSDQSQKQEVLDEYTAAPLACQTLNMSHAFEALKCFVFWFHGVEPIVGARFIPGKCSEYSDQRSLGDMFLKQLYGHTTPYRRPIAVKSKFSSATLTPKTFSKFGMGIAE